MVKPCYHGDQSSFFTSLKNQGTDQRQQSSHQHPAVFPTDRAPTSSRSDSQKLLGSSVKCERNGGADVTGPVQLLSSLCSLPLQLFLPSMRKKPALADGSSPDGDLLQEHWLVDNMFIFENVGFTKDVGNIKFLVCADCETGPIGWHCLDDKNSFYVALERVSHE